ncbi:DUF2470 domain-containing protein, partial [Streptomyces sp. SID5998]|nr:DUF2470 domain-containing protein [Streptomyces sp. SID5998]
SALAATALLAPRGELPALLEFADVAPVPVRNRIRARLRLAGRFTRAGDSLLFQPMRVVLRQPPGAVVIAPGDFAAAEPDP